MSTFPMITATLNLQVPANLVVDLNTVWLAQRNGPMNTLAAAVGDTDTTITLSSPVTAPVPGSIANLVAGVTILIDNEPMIVTAVNGTTVTVERAATFLGALPVPTITSHAAGANIYALTFTSPWDMLASLALRPWVQQQINALGPNSVTFGTVVSGSLTLPS